MTNPQTAYVILGAAGGIGAEVCHKLAENGSSLLLAGRNVDKLETLKDSLPKTNEAAVYLTHALDATLSNEVDELFAKASEFFGTISGAANLIGSILIKPAHQTTDDEFDNTLSVNTRTAFYTLRAAARCMLSTGGSIVLTSTAAASIGLANHEAIATAKGAINGLVLSAAATYATRGIRVNAVAPGLVETPLSAKIRSNELALKASKSLHALGRIGKPSDVATAICWLLDPTTSWVTGQIIGVDGGLSTVRSK